MVHPALTGDLADAIDVGEAYLAALGRPARDGDCYVAAWNVAAEVPLVAIVQGNWRADDGDLIPHHWNVLPDGTIVDVTAGQFTGDAGVHIIDSDHPDHDRYWSLPGQRVRSAATVTTTM